jgi:hypothetical protein
MLGHRLHQLLEHKGLLKEIVSFDERWVLEKFQGNPAHEDNLGLGAFCPKVLSEIEPFSLSREIDIHDDDIEPPLLFLPEDYSLFMGLSGENPEIAILKHSSDNIQNRSFVIDDEDRS